MSSKVTLIEGLFNEIPLPNNYIAYIEEENAFNHWNDLVKNLEECMKVIKPGGKMILINR